MIETILAIKFVHLMAAGAMLGTWLAIASFMLLARRSNNPSVVALVAQFAVRLEWFVMIPALALQPISGFPLAAAIGLSPADDFWIELSLAIYVAVVAAWLAALRLEIRIRKLARQAALGVGPFADAQRRGDAAAFADSYRRLFRLWAGLACVIMAGMVALFLVMVWQPRLD